MPISLEEAWHFFSAPENLKEITPSYMGFQTLSKPERSSMYAGQIITYYIKPLLGLKLFWMTEITHVAEMQYFVDEQRYGPYAFWHHTHFFKSVPGGVQMIDLVHYKLPFGFLGQLAHKLFVKNQLKEIFNYRHKVLDERFGTFPNVS